jgi:hypothetical protein
MQIFLLYLTAMRCAALSILTWELFLRSVLMNLHTRLPIKEVEVVTEIDNAASLMLDDLDRVAGGWLPLGQLES